MVRLRSQRSAGHALNSGPSPKVRLRRRESAPWASFQIRGSTIRHSLAHLYSGRLTTRASIVGCHPSSAAAARTVAPPRTRSNARRTSSAASGSTSTSSGATAAIAVWQLPALGTGARISLCLSLPPSSHASDDDAAIICRDCMANPVEQHRGRIARSVAVRAIGIKDLDASVGERPEGIVGGELITGQARPLLHQQDACTVLQAECKSLRETGALSHWQRSGAVLEHVADDCQVIRAGVALARLPLAVGSRGSFLL